MAGLALSVKDLQERLERASSPQDKVRFKTGDLTGVVTETEVVEHEGVFILTGVKDDE